MKKLIMQTAHKIAKTLTGNYSARLSVGLRQAWAEIKGGEMELKELVGSEKQVKWANDIRNKVVNKWEETKELMLVPETSLIFISNTVVCGLLEDANEVYYGKKYYDITVEIEELLKDRKNDINLTIKKVFPLIEAEYNKVLSNTEAKFFIDNRLSLTVGHIIDKVKETIVENKLNA